MLSCGNNIPSDIHESQAVRDVLNYCSYNTLVVFDLDNTVIRPTHSEDLGSDQCFVSLFNYAISLVSNPEEARLLIAALNDHIQTMIEVKLVEPYTPKLIQILRDVNIPVIGLTSRGFTLAEITNAQLNKVGVKFTDLDQATIKLDIQDPSRGVYFKDGVIYCEGSDKGKCLSEFFKQKKLKQHVVMIDDGIKNLTCVKGAINQFGLGFVGLRYGLMDGRVSSFNMGRAIIRLMAIKNDLSPHIQDTVSKLKLDENNNEIFSLKP